MRQLDKNLGILVVDPVSAVVSTVKRVLSELGYKNIFQADSVLDGLNTLGSNKIEWIFTSLFHGQKLSGMHFLRLPLEFEAYRGVKTSVLLNGDEADFMPSLFGLGMCCSHLRPITYNSFKAELDRYLSRLKSNQSLPQAIATDLRDHLTAKNSIDEIERLELGLYKWADSSPEQKLRVIRAQLKGGNNLEAMLGMKQLLANSPDTAGQVGELSKKYLGIDNMAEYKARINAAIAVVVDSDSSQQNFVAECLKEMGVKDVKTFDKPEEASNYFKTESNVDLLVTEWKLQGMDGGGFIQHAKHGSLRGKPVIIYSAKVEVDDHKLIQEIGGVYMLSKPLSKKAFKEEVSEFFSRWRYPVEGDDIEQKILQALQSGDMDFAQQLMAQFDSMPKVERQRKVTLKATYAYHAGQYLEARTLIIEASKIKLPTHREIGLLGKVLLKLGQFSDAQKCFDQANQMVPGNVERLCSLADISAALGKGEETMGYINAAKNLVGDDPLVNSTFARHAAALGKPEEAKRYMVDEDVAKSVVAHMNNLGVAYANTGKFQESIASYQKALNALGEHHEELRGTVFYNLGLALARQGRLKEALTPLHHASKHASVSVAQKALRLEERVKQSVESSQPLALKDGAKEIAVDTAKAIDAIPKSALEEYVLAQNLKPGEQGLFLIYLPGDTKDLELTSDFPKVIKKSA